MKEAFWGVLIVVLGLFGIVVVNLFQNITVENDRTYYVIKEATEGAAFDAIDLAHYRLNGTIRIVEDKFVENLTRRFAENISKSNYKIVVEDVNEMPPKVSLRVETGVGMLNTGLFQREDPFNIVNRVDAIIETKYTVEDLEFAGITEEEWKEKLDEPIKGDVCTPTIGDVDDACIDGDVMYTGDEEINIQNKICIGQTPPSNVSKKINYKVCECGKWVEKSETLTASPNRNPKNYNEWIYEWRFYIEGKNRVINQVIKERVLELQCTKGIEIYVPDDIDEKNQNNVENWPYEPPKDGPKDNSRYEICPPEGIKIPIGMYFVAHPNYIPPNSVNRNLTWSIPKEDNAILGVEVTNPGEICNTDKMPCYSIAKIKANKIGTTYLKVETLEMNKDSKGEPIARGQSATCKVEVYDGKVDSIGCEDINVEVGKESVIGLLPNPKNATIHNYTYKIANTAVATVSKDGRVTGEAGGTTTLTITETITGKTGICTIKVPSPPEPPKSYSGSDYSGGSSTSNGGYWKVVEPNGKVAYYPSYDKAKLHSTSTNTIYYKNSGANQKEIKYAVVASSSSSSRIETIFNGNVDAVSRRETIYNSYYVTTTVVTDLKTGKVSTNVVDNTPKKNSNSGNDDGGYSKNNSSSKPTYDKSNGYTYVPSSNTYVKNSPSSSGGCLDENTKILTLDGYKNIRDIKIGDKVLSYNSNTKENEYKEVTMVYKHINMKDVLYTMVVNNKVIKATRLHRFYVKTKEGYEYKKVEDLKIGDLLMDSKGNYYPIRKISNKFMISNYYDIEVNDNHNYYVGRDNILVHNRKVR